MSTQSAAIERAARELSDGSTRANPYMEMAGSPAYAKASAVEPNFADKTLWPRLCGKELFLKETWPKARLLVWAHPGKEGVPKQPRADREQFSVLEPANWLEDGKPATELWDAQTDLLLPTADKKYVVSFRDCGRKQEFRHITVEKNAALHGGGDGVGRQIHGNVWIKVGGAMGSQGATSFLGTKHTFFRCDDDNPQAGPARCVVNAQYYHFAKTDGASVEFLGRSGTGDEFGVNSLVIIGPDSVVQPGRNASPKIGKTGTVALMDGAYLGNWVNTWQSVDLTIEGGSLLGGLPDRPLTRNATVAVGFKNHTKAQYDGPGREESGGKVEQYRRVPSIIATGGATIRSHTADAAKARLVITWMGEKGMCEGRPIPKIGSGWGDGEFGFWTGRRPDVVHRYVWMDSLPRGIDAYIDASVTIECVELDCFRKGGLLLSDPASMSKWKDVRYGPHNAAKGQELITTLSKIGRGGDY
jgi:hypothetical protein